MAEVKTDWGAIQAAILAWFEDLAANETGVDVYWRDDAIQQYAPGIVAQVLLHLSAIEVRGVKNVLYESTGADGSKLSVPKSTQLLRVTLDVSVQAGTQVPGTLAQTLLQNMCVRSEIAELRADLDALPVALSTIGPITDVEFEQDGVRLTQATSEWVLYVHDVYQDDTISVETIENVYGEGTPPDDVIVEPVDDGSGDLLP